MPRKQLLEGGWAAFVHEGERRLGKKKNLVIMLVRCLAFHSGRGERGETFLLSPLLFVFFYLYFFFFFLRTNVRYPPRLSGRRKEIKAFQGKRTSPRNPFYFLPVVDPSLAWCRIAEWTDLGFIFPSPSTSKVS
jgi:hypothetical protein